MVMKDQSKYKAMQLDMDRKAVYFHSVNIDLKKFSMR